MGKREKRERRTEAKRARGSQREGAAGAGATGERYGNYYIALFFLKVISLTFTYSWRLEREPDEMTVGRINR